MSAEGGEGSDDKLWWSGKNKVPSEKQDITICIVGCRGIWIREKGGSRKQTRVCVYTQKREKKMSR